MPHISSETCRYVIPFYRTCKQTQPSDAMFGFLYSLCQFCLVLQPAEWLLSLFSCLAELPYRVMIFPSRKTSAASTSANAWVTLSGTLGETSPVPIPRGALEFVFRVSEWLYSIHCSSVMVYWDIKELLCCSTRIWASLQLWGLDMTTPGLPQSGWWNTWLCVMMSLDTHTSK